MVAGHCGVDCAVSGIEVAAASDAIALEQLCRPSESVERAALPTDPRRGEICAASRIDCVDGVVGLCDAPGATVRALGVCVHGCADGISVEPEDILTSDGVAAILCRRDHAERR
ncbi:hypothetical protein AKJ09_08506 [Labilithrix luteola]|uniref:Uncharacterized protein n=1 Tax=Labilithrix luteola TaxID=1391654 RepID=A0A0K1Q7X8_9BACT|nr:hypothetical protein AKJ09_08506 [Labilithrix luteola]